MSDLTLQMSPEPGESPPRAVRGLRRRGLTIALIVIAGLLLSGATAGGLYYRSVRLPEPLFFPSTTTLYYSDGKTVLAQLGEVSRTPLTFADIQPEVVSAAVASADEDFWGDDGGRIARSVARMSFDVGSTSPSERVRLAVLARKLDGSQTKEELIEQYLNIVPFGRQTYGVEAAARAYFGKSADKTSIDVPHLTTAEAIALIIMTGQPEADPDDPSLPGYDPTRSSAAMANAKNRWAEVRKVMVHKGWLTEQQAASLTYPTTVQPSHVGPDSRRVAPSRMVITHVLSELTHAVGSPFFGQKTTSISDGGYHIVTTIDARAQAALEKSADRTVAGSVLDGQPENLAVAAVMVEPGTGRVLGYYGGRDDRDADYAGVYVDEMGAPTGFGMHSPGGSFTVHTLAAALKNGISLKSSWQWQPHDLPGRSKSNQIRNDGVCPSDPAGKIGSCSLLDSSRANLNVPLYDVTVRVGPQRVLEMARAAGITTMWTDDHQLRDLSAPADLRAEVPAHFDTTLGLGQYPVTVLDQANTMATYGAGGVPAPAHFVSSVRDGDQTVYREKLSTGQAPILSPDQIADLDYALTRTSVGQLTGFNSAAKTGNWEPSSSQTGENGTAWMLGYTSSLAMAVWIGNVGNNRAPIRDKDNKVIYGVGLPMTIYRIVMSEAHSAMGLTPTPFPPVAFGGRETPPYPTGS